MSNKILFQGQDDWGPLLVIEEDGIRKLSFGPGDEQSRQNSQSPTMPEHEYIQAMLLSLLFIEPKRALVLGLGGGCLVNALHHSVAGINITAVELRSTVIDLALRFFRLPHGKKITLVNDDANHYLTQPNKKVDLLYADIYQATGVDETQLSDAFLQACCAQLKQQGYLILNCWHEHSESQLFAHNLRRHFCHLYGCHVSSGNWIVFASNQTQALELAHLKSQALHLKKSKNIDLTRFLSQFKKIY
ncbi:spermidine synthase [Motilimonas eburnea]|uniref:spermidine synthase n=1 Tax=Motilimonas eburnea TaxID=1737488 RepID=UPI001E33F27D|nr:spermidine synthase [Motilimonas eburnea]MCE2571323.1 spermidine synthase [Motilimonas eburnea]